MRPDPTEQIVQAASIRWPSLAVEPSAFHAHVTRLGIEEAALANHGSDLVLAFACSCGLPEAHRHLRNELLREAAIVRGRLSLDDDALSEVVQIALAKLLSGSAPRITTYSASGPLGAWLRAIVLRVAFDQMRKRPFAEEPLPLETVAGQALALDVAGDGATQLPRLRAALDASLRNLTAEDRALLKLHYLDGVNLDRLALLTQVHRSTIVRRLAMMRKQIVAEVASRMGIQFGTHPSELRSLWRTFGAEVQVTFSRLLSG